MGYPNTWKEDRRNNRAGGSQAPRGGRVSPRPGPPPGGRLGPLRSTVPLGRAAIGGARIAARFIPGLGLALLGAELGWWYYQSQQSGNPHGWLGPAGWTYGGPCAGFSNPTVGQYHAAGIEHCIGGSVIIVPLGDPIPDNHTSYHLLYPFGSKGKDREWWWRSPSTFPDSVPIHPGVYPTPIAPSPIQPGQPTDPMDIPLEPAPQVHPDPIPWSGQPLGRLRTWRSPTEGRRVGPAPERRLEPARRARPSDRPATIIELPPRPGPAPSSPGSHTQKPPKGRGNKERKLKTKSAAAFNLVRRVFEAAFEGIDIIEAIFDALPKHIRDRYPGAHRDPVMMLEAINLHWQTIDLQEMVGNLIWNELEDFIYGGLGKISQQTAIDLNLSTGPQFGSGSRRAEVIAWRRRQVEEAIKFLVSETETFK